MRNSSLAGAAFAFAVLLAPAVGFGAGDPAAAPAAAPALGEIVEGELGLKYIDTVIGTGEMPKDGQVCFVQYTGWLSENGEKGKKFDSSVDRGQPFAFKIGLRRVIPGWDLGVATMRVGGKRTLIVPPELAYGSHGTGNGAVPPNATLIFDVELVEIRDAAM
jgi:peptidylprolyl isomerase